MLGATRSIFLERRRAPSWGPGEDEEPRCVFFGGLPLNRATRCRLPSRREAHLGRRSVCLASRSMEFATRSSLPARRYALAERRHALVESRQASRAGTGEPDRTSLTLC
jgi:hypothetical protein